MSHIEPVDISKETIRFGAPGTIASIAGAGGLVLLVLAAVAGFTGINDYTVTDFLRAYLIAFAFFLSIALGALFFVLIHHLTRAGWSVVVRRLAELMMQTLPVLGIASLPILVGVPHLYGKWAAPETAPHAAPHADHGAESHPIAHAADHHHTNPIIEGKRPYLNVPSFIGRIIGYFVIWSVLGLALFRFSTKQDESGEAKWSLRSESLSAPGMVIFGLTLSFASFDLLMSLEPEWFSSIFGVYYFAGSVLGAMSFLALFAMAIQRRGILAHAITTEHYHDIGKLMFGFVVFWGYIAFSQYMLIWYANIPEETQWFWPKASHLAHPSWLTLTFVLLFGHLIVPLFGLISRHVKRWRFGLAFWAVWLLVMHYIDLYWIVTPSFVAFDTAHTALQNGPVPVEQLPLDALCLVGLFGVFVAAMLRPTARVALVPHKDPRLDESLAFENF